jgi:hypothetical protein
LIEAQLPTFDQRFLIGRLAQPGTYLGSGALVEGVVRFIIVIDGSFDRP